MPAQAPDTRSVPYRGRAVNPRRQENSQSRARCADRVAVAVDKRLPMGARTTYVLLDDYAGRKGTGWPKQTTLAHRLGASRQSVQRWIRDLERCGWLVIERTGRAHRYTLRWAWASGSQTGGHRIPICKPVVMQQLPPAPEPPAPPEAPATPEPVDCSRCGNTGTFVHVLPATIGAGGKRMPERRFPVKCGCRDWGAIMRDREKCG